MKYVSIDIETTGLEPYNHQIIEFAAVIADTNGDYIDHHVVEKGVGRPDKRVFLGTGPIKTFHRYVLSEEYNVSPYCLNLHKDLWPKVAEACAKAFSEGSEDDAIPGGCCLAEELVQQFRVWLKEEGVLKTSFDRINLAGKNLASFDIPFLNQLGWEELIPYRHRIIDPSVWYMQDGDKCLPDLKTCKERAGISGKVSHTALDDALDVVELITRRPRA